MCSKEEGLMSFPNVCGTESQPPDSQKARGAVLSLDREKGGQKLTHRETTTTLNSITPI